MTGSSTPAMSRHSDKVERIEVTEEREVLSPEELQLKKQEEELAIVKELKSSPEWYQDLPYRYMTASAKEHSLTASSLRGPHKILRRPLKFFNEDKSKCVIVLYLGDQFNDGYTNQSTVEALIKYFDCRCDNNGIHNGLLATLLDEHLAFVTLPALPNYTGFTANLNVNYLDTVNPNQWLVINGVLEKVEGRKAFADAWIENLDGVRLTEARALYISPRT